MEIQHWDDLRVANRMWLSQCETWGSMGESQCNHRGGCTYFIPTKEKLARAQTSGWCGLLSASKTCRKMIFSLRDFAANGISSLSKLEAWKMEQLG